MEDLSLSNNEATSMDNLRASVRNNRRTYSTWVEQDDSGDYDPNADPDAKRVKYQHEPAFEPVYRRDCTACTRSRMVCSYRAGGDRQQPCTDCVRLNRQCILPTPRAGMGTGPPPPLTPTPTPEPTVRTRGRGLQLTPPPEPVLERPTHPMRSRSMTAPPRPVARASQQTGQQAKVFNIYTRLAHPINFNFETNDKDPIPCHWCNSMSYGLLGLGVVNASVFDCGDGEGYVELENGHTAHGHLPSRMCVDCTTHRVSIISCKVHEMDEILKMKGVEVDPRLAAWYMERPEKFDDPPFEWCSICPYPAYYSCSKSCAFDAFVDDGKKQPENSSPDQIDLDGPGCGLRLCTECMVEIVGCHDGDLSRYLTVRLTRTQNGTDGTSRLRADVSFLHSDGELMRRVRNKVAKANTEETEAVHPSASQLADEMDWEFDVENRDSGAN